MALSFKCRNCNENIVVRYLTKGEVAKCQSCGTENVVPEDAIITDELSSAEKFLKKENQVYYIPPTIEMPKPKPDSATGWDLVKGIVSTKVLNFLVTIVVVFIVMVIIYHKKYDLYQFAFI